MYISIIYLTYFSVRCDKIVEVTQIEVVSSNGKNTQKITVDFHNEK